MDFQKEREDMVKNQIIKRGIKDSKVITAMLNTPREKFVLKQDEKEAYLDCPLPIGMGQTISQPYMVALMTQCLSLEGNEQVLEIGTGSGYQTAILAKLSQLVYTVERIEELTERAKLIFKELHLENINTFIGDGSQGLKKYSPFDAIIVTAGARMIPQNLVDQLKDKGRIVIPVGSPSFQELLTGIKIDGKLKTKNYGGCIFVPLVIEQ